MVEIQRLRVGRRCLHRQVAAQIGMGAARVIEQADIGQDDRVHTEIGGIVDVESQQAAEEEGNVAEAEKDA